MVLNTCSLCYRWDTLFELKYNLFMISKGNYSIKQATLRYRESCVASKIALFCARCYC